MHKLTTSSIHPGRQNGLVLFVALIALVSMTLAGIAVMRTVGTTSIIAGNLAFHESATLNADVAVRRAIDWLNTGGVSLDDNSGPSGYSATGLTDDVSKSTDNWPTFWNAGLGGKSASPEVTDTDTGNKGRYFIQRLCTTSGPPGSIDSNPQFCRRGGLSSNEATKSKSGGGYGGGASGLNADTASMVYYRITVRVEGPRNTVSFVQALYLM